MDDLPGWRHAASHDGGICTIALEGELDIAAAPSLQALFYEQLRAGKNVRVDLAAVTFLDSSILGALVNGLHNAEKFSVTFTVVNPSRMPLRLLTLTGLLELLTDAPAAVPGREDAPS